MSFHTTMVYWFLTKMPKNLFPGVVKLASSTKGAGKTGHKHAENETRSLSLALNTTER